MPITLGGDPEFELMDRRGVVHSASNIVRSHLSGSIGRDGGGSQVEFRPRAAETPEQVVRNFKNIFRTFSRRYPEYGLGVKGDRYPLGAHIHFGFGDGMTIEAKQRKLGKVYDFYLGRHLVNLSGRARGSFKHLSNLRGQPHGFEYRTLPTGIFKDPEMVRIVYKIALKVTEKWHQVQSARVENILSSGKASREDFLDIGLTEEETDFFFNFIQLYRNTDLLVGNIVGKWAGSSAEEVASLPVDIEVDEEDRLPAPTPRGPYTARRRTPQTRQVVPGVPITNGVVPVFRDDWDSEIQLEVRRFLSTIRFRFQRGIRVVLYGLSESRGNVFSVQVGATPVRLRSKNWINYANFAYPGVSHDGAAGFTTIYIGLGFRYRNDPDLFGNMRTNLLNLLKDIVKVQSRKMWREGLLEDAVVPEISPADERRIRREDNFNPVEYQTQRPEFEVDGVEEGHVSVSPERERTVDEEEGIPF